MHELFWRMLGPPINTARRQVLDLPPLSIPTAQARTQAMLHLYGFSPLLVPRPADWPAQYHVTGYWFLDPPAAWQPPPAVAAFLAAGPPPVYVGFGSMRAADPQAQLALILDALAQAGERGVILTPDGLPPVAVPETVLLVNDIPHAWLFPQMAAVVHHGGAGTTAAGLRAGRPTVVVPFFTDQPFWGRRVHDLGLGPPPLPHKRLTASGLAAAIRQARHDPQIQARAAALSTQLQAEDGVTTAIAALEHYLTAAPAGRPVRPQLVKEPSHVE
jgi:sterol 3beta-glucosyltransferase